MIRTVRVSISLFLLVLLTLSTNELLQGDVYIAEFPDNKKGAVSLTFDDGCPSTFSIIVPTLNRYHVKGTFFLIPNLNFKNDEWKKWKKLSDAGFEIGNHTCDHEDLTKLDTAKIREEIAKGQAMITERIGKKPISFAHPYHHHNSTVDRIVFRYELFTRIEPEGFCSWHGWVDETLKEEIRAKICDAINKSKWYVVAAHGIGDGWSPVKKDLFQFALRYMDQNRQDLYIGTFGNVGLYIKERQKTSLSVINGDHKKTIRLECPLQEAVYSYPLTIVVKNNFPGIARIKSLNSSPVTYNLVGDNILVYAKPNSVFEITW